MGSKTPSPPRSARIDGQKWAITYVPLDGAHGEVDIDHQIIRINSSIPLWMQATALVHEIAHVVWFLSRGIDERLQEEPACVFAESALRPIIKNKRVLDWVRHHSIKNSAQTPKRRK